MFEEDPGRLVRLFRICQIHEARPDRALSLLVRERAHLLTPALAQSEEASSALRAMLTEGGRVYGTLNALREHGLLYRLVPEFAGLHCLVQFEFYHRWTADVHTLRCLMELDTIYAGETDVDQRYRAVVLGSEAPSLLYAILFLHDIAKSGGIEGHAERGVPIADKILERLGFDAREREIAAGVIRHHLVMGLYWQRHDIDDPANIERFARLMGDEQVLRSLFVHTRCDARATSPDLWTDFKDGQHWTLYRRTLAKLAGDAIGEDMVVCAEAGGVEGTQKKAMDDFGVRYKKRFNDDVKLYAPYVYDAVSVMVDAMQRAKSSDPAKYLPELAKTSGYKGVTGTISFDQKGDIKNGALTLYTYKGGKRDQLAVVR